MKKKNDKKIHAFSLSEILIILVILGVILSLAIPSIINVVDNSKRSSFFVSVSNVVNSLEKKIVLNEKELCMYDYSKDELDKNNDIGEIYILVHKEESKNIYSVYAIDQKQKNIIDVYDFSTINESNNKEWNQFENNESSYTWYATSLYTNLSENTQIFDFKNCK